MTDEIDQDEVLRLINEEGYTAEEILKEYCPTATRRFRSAMKSLDKVLKDVREVFPDACYYSASDATHLLLGKSHSQQGEQQQELSVDHVCKPLIGGGDW